MATCHKNVRTSDNSDTTSHNVFQTGTKCVRPCYSNDTTFYGLLRHVTIMLQHCYNLISDDTKLLAQAQTIRQNHYITEQYTNTTTTCHNNVTACPTQWQQRDTVSQTSRNNSKHRIQHIMDMVQTVTTCYNVLQTRQDPKTCQHYAPTYDNVC